MKISPVLPILLAGAVSAAWKERTPEGHRDKLVISSEVPIPTATATQVVTATETQVVTHVVSKPVQPAVDSYQLGEHEEPRALGDKTTLLGRYVIDVTAPVYNYTASGAGAQLAASGAAMLGLAGAAAALI